MWVLSSKYPGWRCRAVEVVVVAALAALAALSKARVFAITPSFSSVGASVLAFAPLGTWTVTVGAVPAPV